MEWHIQKKNWNTITFLSSNEIEAKMQADKQ